jgi:WhiB family transcriptional regulator, redox-sensing transcriptional regulator
MTGRFDDELLDVLDNAHYRLDRLSAGVVVDMAAARSDRVVELGVLLIGGAAHDRPVAGEWTEQAACADADPDIFFPERGKPTAPAKAICAVCPVRVECLEYALDASEKFGVWGGTSEKERRRLRRDRRDIPRSVA